MQEWVRKAKRATLWCGVALVLMYLLALAVAALVAVAVPLMLLLGGGVLWWKTRKGAV